MKKNLQIGIFSVLLLASSVMASNQLQIGYDDGSVSAYGPYQALNGGEFTVNPLGGWLGPLGYADNGVATMNIGVPGTFQTFCVEYEESLGGFSSTYEAVVSPNAMAGGVGGAGDPLSCGTGWLYCQFATGKWAEGLSYNYNGGEAARKASAADLQKALWWLEDEGDITYDDFNMYMKGVVDHFGSEADAKADGAVDFGVFALSLTGGGAALTGDLHQDVLWYTPDGGFTLAMLGLGFMGIETLRRKLKA